MLIILARRRPTGYPLAALYGAGDDGWIVSGGTSKFWTTDAGTTECATPNSDPIGLIENLAGTAVVVDQGVANNQPIYTETAGIKGWKAGKAAQRRWLEANLGAFGQEFTAYLIEKFTSRPYAYWMYVSPAAPVVLFYREGGSYVPRFYETGTPFLSNNNTFTAPDAYVVHKYVRKADSPHVHRSTMTLAQLAAEGSMTDFTYPVPSTGFSYVSTGTKEPLVEPVRLSGSHEDDAWDTEHYFSMLIDRALSTAEQETVEAQLITEFGALA